MPLPKPGDKEYEDMIDFMRADLASGMQLSKIEMVARKLVKEDGRDFDEEFAKYKNRQADALLILVWPDGTWCHKRHLDEYGWKSDDYYELNIDGDLSDDEIDLLDKEELHAKGTRPLVD